MAAVFDQYTIDLLNFLCEEDAQKDKGVPETLQQEVRQLLIKAEQSDLTTPIIALFFTS